MFPAIDRRTILAVLSSLVFAIPALGSEAYIITPREAFDRAALGDIVLIDIRTEDEWRETGVGAGAHPISMRDRGFLAELDKITDGDKAANVALICATGGRSAWLRERLMANGYTTVIDVSQGMLGNHRGPGWIEQGLPIDAHN